MRELTPEERAIYKTLQVAVRHASYEVGVCNNDATRAAYDKAIAEIMAFESEHDSEENSSFMEEDKMDYSYNAESLRKEIIKCMLAKPVLGKNYVDWHDDDGGCWLTLITDHGTFDINILKQ